MSLPSEDFRSKVFSELFSWSALFEFDEQAVNRNMIGKSFIACRDCLMATNVEALAFVAVIEFLRAGTNVE